MYPGMYGPFVPDMYSRNFVHYDKFGGSDPILERPINTTGYHDLIDSPIGGYELIQPRENSPRLQRGSTVYKEHFSMDEFSGGLKFILVSLFLTLTVYFLIQLIGIHFGNLSSQTYLILFLIFSVLWIITSVAL